MAHKRLKRKSKTALFKIPIRLHRAILSLKKMNKRQKIQALRNASDTFYNDVSHAIHKLRSIPPNRVKPYFKRSIQKHGKVLRKVVNKRSSVKTRRKLIEQKGGFPFLPLIGTALASIFK